MTTTIEMIASQVLFWGITIFSIMIWYEFHRSVDGRMRILVLRLFASKIWVYGLAGAFYLCYDFGYFRDFPQIYLRLACNLPMVVIMYQWWVHIRMKKADRAA